jgi:hypothetical protein
VPGPTTADRTAITLDVDWAPDFMIDHVAELLVGRGVAATWLVTHASPAIDRLRAHPDLFELGIHPNFAAGSTHGSTPEEVLEHCLAIVPEARCMRTHGLLQSSPLLAVTRNATPIRVDLSLFLPHARLAELLHYPVAGGETMLRIPHIWEDDAEMLAPEPSWSTAALAAETGGLAVFCFHPVHVYLNAAGGEPYEALRARGYPHVTADDARPLIGDGPGTGTAFLELVELGSRRIADLAYVVAG